MKSLFHSGNILTKRFISTALVGLFVCLASPTRASDQSGFQVNPNAEAGDAILCGKLRGLVFGVEDDPGCTEGFLWQGGANSDGPLAARIGDFHLGTGEDFQVPAR